MSPKTFPTGRWNRDLGHRLEIVNDAPACWATCICGFMGEVRYSTEEADVDAEAHEREVFERGRARQRFVRGRFE